MLGAVTDDEKDKIDTDENFGIELRKFLGEVSGD